jgi:hypothetical protein
MDPEAEAAGPGDSDGSSREGSREAGHRPSHEGPARVESDELPCSNSPATGPIQEREADAEAVRSPGSNTQGVGVPGDEPSVVPARPDAANIRPIETQEASGSDSTLPGSPSPAAADVDRAGSLSGPNRRVTRIIRTSRWMRKAETNRLPPKQLSWWLRPMGLCFLASVLGAILIIIATLWAISAARHGFAYVSFAPASYEQKGRLPWNASALWTTLPSIFMQIPVFLWAAMESQLKKLQPVMEMTKPGPEVLAMPTAARQKAQERQQSPPSDGGAARQLLRGSTVKKTLLLDYNNYFIGQDAYMAFRNGHRVTGSAMIVRYFLLLSAALAASLFAVATVSVQTQIHIDVTQSFNDYETDSVLPDTQTLFDQVSDTLINNLTFFPWTTRDYSIAPFELHDSIATSSVVTATVPAVSSNLSCVPIPNDSIIFSRSSTNVSTALNFTVWSISAAFNDRGCNTSAHLVVDENSHQYTHAWSEQDCSSLPASDPASHRLGIIAGDYDESQQIKLVNFSLISCIPLAWNSTVTATISFEPDETGRVVAMNPINSSYFPSSLLQRLIHRIPDLHYLGGEPVTPTLNSTVDFDGLGRLVYNYAQGQRNSSDPFSTDALQAALANVWPALWAIFITRDGYTPNNKTMTLDATQSVSETRLLATDLSAALIVAFLSAALGALLCVALYCRRNLERLLKSLDSMLGHALLFEKSPDVIPFLEEVRKTTEDAPGFGGDLSRVDLVELVAKRHALHSWRCGLAGNGGSSSDQGLLPVLQLRKPLDSVDGAQEPEQTVASREPLTAPLLGTSQA